MGSSSERDKVLRTHPTTRAGARANTPFLLCHSFVRNSLITFDKFCPSTRQQGLRRYGPVPSPANEIEAIYSGWQRVVQTYVVQYSPRLINYGAKGLGLTRKVGYA